VALVKVTDEPEHAWRDEGPAFAYVGFGAEYWWLYPSILELQTSTGQLIDSQTDAFFSGSDLEKLADFTRQARDLASGQPDEWEQHTANAYPSGAPVFEIVRRGRVFELLDGLDAAIAEARRCGAGVWFVGE
jgi:hypothetical protein